MLQSVPCLVTQLCPTLFDPMDCSSPGSSVHGGFLGKNTRVSCHPVLQGIFPTQGSNPGLLHLQADSLPSEPPGKPNIRVKRKKEQSFGSIIWLARVNTQAWLVWDGLAFLCCLCLKSKSAVSRSQLFLVWVMSHLAFHLSQTHP